MNLPELGSKLSEDQIKLLEAVAQSCRHSIVKMVTNAQSGHPGGSLSTIDYLAVLYTFIINQSNEPVIVSNGHISPAVYSILGEMGAIDKATAIEKFRKSDDVYEGHINRHVNGVWYGTGPLGVGGSVSAGLAHGLKLQNDNRKMYLIMGDGEQQEGQVYEMMNYAHKYALSNLILFIDYNQVQLTASLDEIMPTNIRGHYEASGWEVLECDAHDFHSIWQALSQAQQSDKPVCIIGNSIMGQGIDFMEETGRNYQASWHGKAPDPETGLAAAEKIAVTAEQAQIIAEFLAAHPTQIKTDPVTPATKINPGTPTEYSADTLTDCRSAYGNALGQLAELNKEIVALTADLEGSVKTGSVKKVDPARHIEVGIAEQHMLSNSGGLSLTELVPFCSTFGAFMTSRAKDQARVNDINHTNVKMVATHCGLSVGEDGPTHQAIDDISSFTGFFNTTILEPADPNQCDRIIRYAAQTHGNFYVRMGRAKIPVITKPDGSIFYDTNYTFAPGKADVIREGDNITLVASGPCVIEALQAQAQLATAGTKAEVIAVSSFVPFDHETIAKSLAKTGKVITIQDHHIQTGLKHFVNETIVSHGLQVKVINLGVKAYQLSGTASELYKKAGIDTDAILAATKELL